MQSWAPAGDRGYQQTLRFAELVNDLGAGRIVIEPQPAGAIVPVRQEHEALMKGTIEISHLLGAWGTICNDIGMSVCSEFACQA